MRRLMLSPLAAMMCLVLGAAHALAPIPDETGYLTDQTGIIEPEAIAQIQLRLAKYQVESRRKISVLLVEATPGEELEAYADRVLEKWGLTQLQDGGALLLWSAEGYILIRATEPMLQKLGSEAQSEIISRWIVPAFAEGDAGRGILDGVERMIAVIAGEPVGERPAPSAAEEGPPAAEDDMLADDSDSAAILIAPPPMETPAWIEMLPADLARLTGAFNAGPVSGARTLLEEAGKQWNDLFVQVQAVILQLRGERIEPPLLPFALNAFYVFGAVLGLVALMLFRRAWGGAAFLITVAGAPALWAATGFTALALCVVAGGILFPFVRRILQAVFRQEGEEDSEAVAAAKLKAQLAAMASHKTGVPGSRSGQPAVSRTPVSVVLPAARTSPSASPAATRRGPVSAQDLEEFTNLLLATVRHVLSRAKLWHLGAAVALCAISVGLALLVGLALVGYFAVRRGVVHRFLEFGSRRDENIRRLLERFPAPDPADLKSPRKGGD